MLRAALGGLVLSKFLSKVLGVWPLVVAQGLGSGMCAHGRGGLGWWAVGPKASGCLGAGVSAPPPGMSEALVCLSFLPCRHLHPHCRGCCDDVCRLPWLLWGHPGVPVPAGDGKAPGRGGGHLASKEGQSLGLCWRPRVQPGWERGHGWPGAPLALPHHCPIEVPLQLIAVVLIPGSKFKNCHFSF